VNRGVEHEAQRADPLRLEVASRVASIRIGVGLTLIVLMGAAIHTLLLFAAITTITVDHLPGERIVRSRWCEHFFVSWAILYIVLIALICLADGGTTSAFAMLFVLPLLFSALSYPPPATAIVGVADVVIFGTVALVSGDGMAYGGFGAFTLACAGVLSIWESSNQRRRRETLADTAQALSSSEESIRLQADKQEEVARFGQLALETVEVDELLDEAVEIIERVLQADLAGVLELLEEGEELLLRAGIGFESDEIGTAQVPIGRASQAGYAVTVSQPVIVEDWRDEKRFRSALQVRARGIRSGVTVLIKGKGEAFGVLAAHSKAPRHFNAQDVSFMQSIAHVLATTRSPASPTAACSSIASATRSARRSAADARSRCCSSTSTSSSWSTTAWATPPGTSFWRRSRPG
jgi:putative methionine-R-sulfoxide reductase with GAF domain